MFDKFNNRNVIKGDIVLKTAIHIGSSSQELIPSAIDNEVLKDVNGKPFIPGSSIKGVLRSFFEKILRGTEKEACTVTNLCLSSLSSGEKRKKKMDELDKQYGQKNSEEQFSKYIYDNICPVCRIFGGTNNGAKLMFRDARLKDDIYFNGYEIRNGVTIDRDTNTAVNKYLYQVEVVPASTIFSFEAIAENVTEEEWKYILLMLKAMEQGYIEIGGLVSRGLGGFELKNVIIEKISGNEIFKNILSHKKNEVLLDKEIERAGEINV